MYPTPASPRNEQYYECWANRAYYRDGWLARSLQVRATPVDMDKWTLHHLDHDFSESTDLASQHPDTLRELVEAFDQAAWKYFVYPLDNRSRPGKFADTPTFLRARSDQPRRFLPGAQTAARTDVIPMVGNRHFRIRTRFHQRTGDEGILWALGDITAGMVMYVEADRLNFHYNGFGAPTNLPPIKLAPGQHDAVLEYEALGRREGRGRIFLDGTEAVAWNTLSPTLMVGPFEGFDVGLDRRAPVFWELYERHGVYHYSGKIDEVWIDPGQRAAT